VLKAKRLRCLSLALLIPLVAQAELRDPTRPGNLPSNLPAISPNTPEAALTLSAIRISNTARYAIINGMTVSVGQKLDDERRVSQIKPGYVVISDHGQRNKLYLVTPIKKP